jgi:hypothetical protein
MGENIPQSRAQRSTMAVTRRVSETRGGVIGQQLQINLLAQPMHLLAVARPKPHSGDIQCPEAICLIVFKKTGIFRCV